MPGPCVLLLLVVWCRIVPNRARLHGGGVDASVVVVVIVVDIILDIAVALQRIIVLVPVAVIVGGTDIALRCTTNGSTSSCGVIMDEVSWPMFVVTWGDIVKIGLLMRGWIILLWRRWVPIVMLLIRHVWWCRHRRVRW